MPSVTSLRLARFGLGLISAVLVSASGCDGTPPSPPIVDDVATPTQLDAQTVRGTAEFGDLVTITGASMVTPAEIHADPYSAAWEAQVVLAAGDNSLSVTATDDDGNVSAPTAVTIHRDAIHAQTLTLSLSRSLVTADDGTLVVHAQIGTSEPVDLSNLALQLDVQSYAKTIAPVTAMTDAAGRADLPLAGLDAAGIGTLVVTAPASMGLSARADFFVHAGLPATIDLKLSDGVQPPASSLTIAAGTDVTATITVADQPNNPILDAPIQLFTDLPGALVAGAHITNVRQAGVWHVVGAVTGTLVSEVVPLTVTPPTGVVITSPAGGTKVAPGASFDVTVTATNGLPIAELDLQASGVASSLQTRILPTGTTTTAQTFTIRVPGTPVLGTIALVAEGIDGAGNRISSEVVTVNVDPAAAVIAVGGFTVTTLAAGDQLNQPRGIAANATTVFVAASGSSRLVSIDRATGVQSALGPTMSGSPQYLDFFTAASQLFASVRNQNRLLRVDAGTGAATAFTANNVFGRQQGTIVVGTDVWTVSDDDRVRRFTASATPPATPTCSIDLSGTGQFPGLQGGGQGILLSATFGLVVTEDNADRIWRVATGAAACGTQPAATPVASGNDVNVPRAIVQATSGQLYYVNNGDGRLMRVDPTACNAAGCAVTAIASGFSGPFGLAFDATGKLLVTDDRASAVFVVSGPF